MSVREVESNVLVPQTDAAELKVYSTHKQVLNYELVNTYPEKKKYQPIDYPNDFCIENQQ